MRSKQAPQRADPSVTELRIDNDGVKANVHWGVVVLVVLLTWLNLASLVAVLSSALVHPVHYTIVWFPLGAGPVVLGALPLMGSAIFLGLCALVATFCLRRGGDSTNQATWKHLAMAWWPAAAACMWIVAWLPTSRGAFLLVMLGMLLVGWSMARFGRAVSEAVTPIDCASGEDPGDATVQAWWRESWFWLVVVCTVALTAFHTYVQIKLHRAMQYGSPDIGYYAEMLLNVVRGRGLYCEAFGHHFFGEHFSPGLYLLVPLYACCPHIELLMAVGALAVLSSAWAVYALTRAYDSPPWVAACMATAYLLYPATSRIIYGSSYGFHEILLAIPLMLWSFYFHQRRRWLWMAVCVVLAISLKENVAIVYAMFGLYVFLRDRRAWWGLALCAACVAHVAVVMYWVVPSYNASGAYSKLYLYGAPGDTPGGLIAGLLLRPDVLIDRLVSWQAFGFALTLTVPVGLLVFRRWLTFVVLPTFVFVCLMQTSAFASIKFWHQASMLAVIWLAATEVVAGMARGNRSNRGRPWLAVFVLTTCALSHYALGFSPLSRQWQIMRLDTDQQDAVRAKLHEMIPESDTVMATARLAAHFVRQDRIYPPHKQPDVPPDWILLDPQDSFADEQARTEIIAQIDGLMTDRAYTFVGRLGSVHVFAHQNRKPAG